MPETSQHSDRDRAEAPELWPATWPPQGEDAETPWLPTDPIPNPEPEIPALGMPDPGIYQGAATGLG